MTNSELATAVKMLSGLNATRAQCSLAVQAEMCVPVAEALGLNDLADHLRRLSDEAEAEAREPRTPEEWAEWGRW